MGIGVQKWLPVDYNGHLSYLCPGKLILMFYFKSVIFGCAARFVSGPSDRAPERFPQG